MATSISFHPSIPALSPSFLYHSYIPSIKSKDFSFTCIYIYIYVYNTCYIQTQDSVCIIIHCIYYSTSRRFLCVRPTPRRVQTIKSPTHGTHSHLRLREVSGCCVCVRAPAFSSGRPCLCPRVCSMHFVCVRACSSASVHARLRPCLCACVRACACVRVRP